MAARACVACGKKIGTFSDWELCKSGNICMDCYRTCRRYPGDLNIMTSEDVKRIVTQSKQINKILSNIDELDYIGHKYEYIAAFDEKTRTVFLPRVIAPSIDEQGFWSFPYESIISAELLNNEEPMPADAVSKVVAGGLLFGVVGAMAGYASAQNQNANMRINHIEVVVSVQNYPTGKMRIDLWKGGAGKDARRAETFLTYGAELVKRLNSIAGFVEQSNSESPAATPKLSTTDEIRQYKALMDDGIITPEEFAAKKKQLLGL